MVIDTSFDFRTDARGKDPLLDATNLEVLQESASSVDLLIREIAALS